MAGILAGYLIMWNELGFSVTLVQKQITDHRTLTQVFGVLLLAGASLFAFTVLVSPLIARLFGAPLLTNLSRVVALSFLIMPFTIIPNALLSIDLNFRSLSIIGFIGAAVGAATTVVLAYFGAGPYALVFGSLAISLTRAVALNIASPFLECPNFNLGGMRGFASFSGSVMLTRSVWYWYSEADGFIVGRVMGPTALGTYSLGRQLAILPMERMVEIINMVSMPAYSSLRGDVGRVAQAYQKTIGLVAVLSFPMFWMLAVIAPDLIGLVLGPKWVGAIPVLQILALGLPIRTIGNLAASPLMALGRATLALRFVLFPATLVPIGLLVGYKFGIAGVAWAWTIAYPIAFIAASNWTKHAFHLSLRQLARPMLIPCLCAIIMVVGLLLLKAALPSASPAFKIAAELICGAVAYLGALYIFSREQFAYSLEFSRALLRGKK